MTSSDHSKPGNEGNGAASGSDQQEGVRRGSMYDTAIQWLLRQRDGDMDAADWEAFTLWLEADARHAKIFDRLAEADAPLDHLTGGEISSQDIAPAELSADNDNPIARFIPWAMASAAAMVLAILIWPQGLGDTTRIATAPGEVQTLALSETITMTVNGGSTLKVKDDAPEVTIESGEVAFAIVSEEPSPLRVMVDGLVLTDIGTEFSVVFDESSVRVAVADGIVAVNPEGENAQVKAGEAVEKARGDDALARSEIDPESVASWREGRLDFDDTPIDRALAQLERSAGVSVTVAPRFAGARLTGSLALDAEPEIIARRMADLVGGALRRDGERWVIE